jgi:hypothetical protein
MLVHFAETLEILGTKLGSDDCGLRHLSMEGTNLGKPTGVGRLPRNAAAPPPVVATLLGSVCSNVLRSVCFHNCSMKDAGATFLAEKIEKGWKVCRMFHVRFGMHTYRSIIHTSIHAYIHLYKYTYVYTNIHSNKYIQKKVEMVDLGLNEVSDSGCTALAKAVSSPGNCVKALQLRINKCRNDGAKALGAALYTDACRLETLVLSANVVGTQGIRALLEAVAHCRTLASLDLSHQKEAVWTEEDFVAGARKLADALAARSRPLRVDLSGIEGMAMASKCVDCACVRTEYASKQYDSSLCLQDMFDALAGALLPLHSASFAATIFCRRCRMSLFHHSSMYYRLLCIIFMHYVA